MFCKKCGKHLSDGSKFCASCGMAVASSAHTPTGPNSGDNRGIQGQETHEGFANRKNESKKTFSVKTLLFVLIPAVIIVVGVVIAVSLFTGNLRRIQRGNRDDILVTDSIDFFREDERIIVVPNNEEVFTINGEFGHWVGSSKDGSVAIFLSDYERDYGGTLWLVTTTEATQIADDVLHGIISASGDGVLYFKDFDDWEEVASLYLYDVESGRSRRITNEAFFWWHDHYVSISPDGRSVGYIVIEDLEQERFYGYLFVNGETERLGENKMPVAIADDGKYVYFFHGEVRDDDWSVFLYVRSEDGEVRLSRNLADGWTDLLFSRDLSQVIFSVEGRSFISRNGEEAERLGNMRIDTVVGTNLAKYAIYFPGNDVIVTGVDCFSNRVVLIWEDDTPNLAYIDSDFETTRIPGTSGARIRNAMLVNNGRDLIFLDQSNNRLSRVAVGDENAEVDRLARDVVRFLASNDGKAIYFLNEREELWFIAECGESSRIADDVGGRWGGSLAMLPDSLKIFFIEDYVEDVGGFLSFSDYGENRQRVRGADDVISVWATPTSIMYRTVDGDIFRSNGDDNFERVVRGDDW